MENDAESYTVTTDADGRTRTTFGDGSYVFGWVPRAARSAAA